MAKRFFPDEIPVGKRLKYGPAQSENPMMEIVGVVSNVRHGGLSASPDPELYAPHSQDAGSTMTMVVRSNNDPDSFALSLKSAVWEVDRNQPVYNLKTMGAVISDSMAAPRGYTMLLVIFAALALILAAVGIYGVMAYSITQRTQEIGIRMALGAQRIDVLKLVLLEGMLLAAVGIVIGLFCTAGLTRFISSFLFGVGVFDVVTYAAITGLLLGIALLACYIPAQRAMKVDPAVALRHQ
jgi:putative ABC transport system permease protein